MKRPHLPSIFRSYSAFSTHRQHASLAENISPTPNGGGIMDNDLEKNAAIDAHTTSTTDTSSQQQQQQQQHQQTRNPPAPAQPYPDLPPSLVKFQNIIGISVPSALRSQLPHRPAQNLGIYKRVVDSESKIKFQAKLSTYLVNFCYLLQIIVGAALTALGAASGPSAAVTILGAVNTIVAGLLTYLKGQGLPGRVEQQFRLLRTLREYIEERERDFSDEGCMLDVDQEIETVVQMYAEVKQTVADNQPGNVLPPRGNISALMMQRSGRGGGEYATGAGMGVGRQLGGGGDGNAGAAGGFGAKAASAAAMAAGAVGGGGKAGGGGVMAELKDLKEKYAEHKREVEEGVDDVQRKAQVQQQSVSEGAQGAVGEVEKVRHEILEEVEEHREKAKEELERLERGFKNL